MPLHFQYGDITTLAVDAIVNAANEKLAPGGGVCGAIFQAAGPQLEQACSQETGEMKALVASIIPTYVPQK